MNKKFSTLAVAAMLASAFTAYAGPGDVVTKLAEGNNGKQYQLRAFVNNGSSWVDKGYLILNEKDGTLSFDETLNDVNGKSVLGKSLWCVDVTLENQGKNPIFDFVNKGEGSVLDVTVGGWSEDRTNWDNTGVYYWVNKKAAHVGGEVRGWEFTPTIGDVDRNVYMFGVGENTDADNLALSGKLFNSDLTDGVIYGLNSYISSTHIATLVWDETSKQIRVAVVEANRIAEIQNKQVLFLLQEAYPVDLTAAQFNSILNTQDADKETVKMTFVKDYNNTEIVNPFSTNEFRAEQANYGVSCANAAVTSYDCDMDGEHNFVYLYKTEADATKNYLRVDTAYANGYGTKFLTFAFESDFGTGKTVKNEAIIPDQYKFRLNYCPTDDSLSIQVMSALYKLQDDGKPWRTLAGNPTTAYKTSEKYGTANVDYLVTKWNDTDADFSTTNPNHPSGLMSHQTNWVKLQDLESSTESRIITVGDAPINTHISFGYGDCATVASEYTSVADGVYYIKNSKGQYLAHPIYNNGDSAPLFVTVNADEQEVAHMPAYQWVVLKKYTDTPAAQATSPVLIANREFDEIFKYDVQLKQAAGAEYMYLSSNMKWSSAVVATTSDSLQFVAVPTESVENQYLGYKKINADSLLVNKYTFNYWHPYATDKFIAKSEKDSTLTVLNGKDAFTIKEINSLIGYDKKNTRHKSAVDILYGFASNVDANGNVVTINNVKKTMKDLQERIPGLAQLKRTVYEVYMNDPYWKVNNNDQFNVGADAYNSSNWDQSGEHYFAFFKENNHVDGKDYYAIVRAKTTVGNDINYNGDDLYPIYEYEIAGNKAGVSDYDGAATLKDQVLVETRTSAFAIERDDTPLYRRFNSTLEGQAGDAQDTLRFYEKYRNEYLMIEANPNFMVEHIDFLGIDAKDKAQGGLAFIVDTAWVNRGAGNIKPQYLISIDRHDKAGTPGVPCTYEHNHYDNQGNAVDAEHCSHATPAVPGFARGKYLINFQRFVDADKDYVKTDDYKWAGYVRAGFKEAVVVADTLYILRDEFKNLPNEEITVEKLASAEVEAQKAYSKEHGNLNGFLSYKYELAGDNHKEATWSMRFVDREKAANEVEADRAFLIESMADVAIAPMDNASWLKMQNGCLVLSDPQESKFNEVVTGGDDALIFNVAHVDGDQVAVDNENIAVEGVSVVAGNGQVTIMGAAGKNVTITNILGKVIANQTIASDNATIAVPAGIVAVAVEGEAAVKAIVK